MEEEERARVEELVKEIKGFIKEAGEKMADVQPCPALKGTEKTWADESLGLITEIYDVLGDARVGIRKVMYQMGRCKHGD